MKSIQCPDILVTGHSIAERSLKPPLVSIIVVNRNYAAYVGDTIHSIRSQDYPWYECFIIDNASTDDSVAVIERSVADDSRFSIKTLPENRGQLGAALQIFDQLRGEFVVCVDADDFLFSNFLASHIQVHLALSFAVGLSSSNIVEIDADRHIITGGRSGFATSCESEKRGLNPAAETVRVATISDADYARLSDATIFLPHWKSGWAWAPGSSNLFRKSVLKLALPDTTRIFGHAAWDNYFCAIVHLMSGSVLIRQHLSAYRYHAKNSFGSSPQINAIRTFRALSATRSATQRIHVLRTLVSRAEEFNWILAGLRFWSTLDLLAGIEELTPRIYFSRGDVQDIFAEHLKLLTKVFGTRVVLAHLRVRMNLASTWRVASKAYGGRVPLSLYCALLGVEVQHAFQRLRRND